MNRFRILLAGALLAVCLAPLTLAAGPGADKAPVLSKADAARLVAVAKAMRADLAEIRELRELPPLKGQEAAQAQRVQALNERVSKNLRAFLEIANLEPAEFVRMVDAENGLDNGKTEHAAPQFEILDEAGDR